MPADRSPPTLAEYLAAYSAAVRALAGSERNLRRGSGLDKLGGPAALLWARESQRDREIFRQCYTETSTGDSLENKVEFKYGVERVKASFGTGYVRLERSASGTDGTIYAGTRILVTGDEGRPRQYAVSADTDVASTATYVEAPIRATRQGAGVAVSTTSSLGLGDSVFDSTFEPTYLECADGTEEEKAADYLDRARKDKLETRVGYQAAVKKACRDAGAANVVVLDAGIFGDSADFGVTHVYVGDAGYSTPDDLLDACWLAVDAVHVLGCDAQVLGMTITPVVLSMTLTLWDSPGAFDQIGIKRDAAAALLDEFNRRPDFWIFRHSSLIGAVFKASDAIREVSISTSPSEPTASFVATLPRYTLSGSDITITLQGPS